MIRHGPAKTAGGTACYEIRVAGLVAGPEMAEVIAQTRPGAPHASEPILCVIEKGTEFSLAARSQLGAMRSSPLVPRPVAVVALGPFLRAFAKTIFLVSGRTSGRVFDNEAAATQWLDGTGR